MPIRSVSSLDEAYDILEGMGMGLHQELGWVHICFENNSMLRYDMTGKISPEKGDYKVRWNTITPGVHYK